MLATCFMDTHNLKNKTKNSMESLSAASTCLYHINVLLLASIAMLATSVLSQPRFENCTSKCGDYDIDYPFGIGSPECYLAGFEVICTGDNTVPVLVSANLTVDQFLKDEGQIVLRKPDLMAFSCQDGSGPNRSRVCLNLTQPFTISARSNKFIAIGCDTTVILFNKGRTFQSGCQTLWSRGQGLEGGGGLGICQSGLPEGASTLCYRVSTISNYRNCSAAKRCSFAAVVKNEVRYSNESILLKMMQPEAEPQPLVVNWAVDIPCGKRAHSNPSKNGKGHLCFCDDGCSGNPYLNDTGSCTTDQTNFPSTPVAIAGGFTLVASFAVGSYVYNCYFPGAESCSAAAPTPGGPWTPTLEDLQRIYKICNISNKIYNMTTMMREKGPLVEYKPLIVEDISQIEPFRAQFTAFRAWVRHHNVVRPYRCNLKEEALDEAMLVYYKFYEHNLHDYLHSKNGHQAKEEVSQEPAASLAWKDRLRVALGTARGLACAHSQGYLHRDVRSSNILMDSNFNAKLIQFGVAMLMTKDTYLKETRGYTDPEFAETSLVTYKSDVYGFGVVLVELLTGKDPSVDVDRSEKEKGVVTRFLLSTDDEIDGKIKEVSVMDELIKVVRLAEECLREKGEKRPSMVDVVEVLNSVIKTECPDMDLNDNLYESLKKEALETSIDLAVEGEEGLHQLLTGSGSGFDPSS